MDNVPADTGYDRGVHFEDVCVNAIIIYAKMLTRQSNYVGGMVVLKDHGSEGSHGVTCTVTTARFRLSTATSQHTGVGYVVERCPIMQNDMAVCEHTAYTSDGQLQGRRLSVVQSFCFGVLLYVDRRVMHEYGMFHFVYPGGVVVRTSSTNSDLLDPFVVSKFATNPTSYGIRNMSSL